MLRVALLRLLETYFRHRWLYLLPLVIALVAGGVYVAVLPPEYSASGKLYVEKTSLLASLTSTTNDGSWWTTPAQLTSNEFSELMATNAFMRSVVKDTKLEQQLPTSSADIDELFTNLRQSLTVTPRGEKLVEIAVVNKDPELAYQLVTSTMNAYVQWKLNNDQRESVVAQDFFKGLIEPYTKELETARANLLQYLQAHPEQLGLERKPEEQIEIDRLQKEVDRAEERVQTAQQNQESAQLSLKKSESITNQTYLSIDQPEVPQKATFSLRTVVRNLAIFLGAGIILTIGGIVAGALIDRSLRFSLDAQHTLGLRVLAMMPTSIEQHASAQTVTVGTTIPETNTNPQTESAVLQPQV